MGPERHKL